MHWNSSKVDSIWCMVRLVLSAFYFIHTYYAVCTICMCIMYRHMLHCKRGTNRQRPKWGEKKNNINLNPLSTYICVLSEQQVYWYNGCYTTRLHVYTLALHSHLFLNSSHAAICSKLFIFVWWMLNVLMELWPGLPDNAVEEQQQQQSQQMVVGCQLWGLRHYKWSLHNLVMYCD